MFRQEVVDARRGEWLGSIIVAAPLSRWLLTALVLALAAAILLFLFFGHYTRRETVTGQLVPSAGLLNIAAPSAGTVARVEVHDGQVVKAGDVLLKLSSEQDSAALGDTHALVGQQLDIQRSRLQADLFNQKQWSKQQADAFQAKTALLRSQLTQIAGQLAIQQKQVNSNQELLEKIEPLAAKGFVSAVQIQQQETAVLDAQAQYKALVRQQLDMRQQLEATQQQLAQLPLDDVTKRNDTERQLASLTQSMAQNEMQRAVVLRAPRDGVVSTVLLKDGQMVSAGRPLLSILPAGSTLRAQLLVPSRAIGFIEPGSRVVLRYQAFAYQKFGQQYGRVTDISRSALSSADIVALVGQSSQQQEPLYRVQVALDSQHVLAYGREEPVKPGMALDADILMDRRRLIEWVFEPLYGMAHHLAGDAAHG
ncbi:MULTISPECIES: HlyD family efflux transporter periplasmic adaptor subunit [Rhodanobacter]|uniref:HlyD family efflux transporter periplasmic adaptor subunit n=1 Tax=Rhodanobacter TaxID=75309 RepID=UPI001E61CC6E|nr:MULTISPECIES: HlyD family efflux transporter periplasmic adaptor subunit [Rhodanobacter]UJJ50342.1 HlyD family secretion protein [Rhodanobacter denitrificans]UJM93058.1 HlyD family secretion protein [Rhodanobacter denitrificans]UJM96589.1 HlyD family secretion protein [Rhodanobacter denitrificans]UJN20581.1 HlyD family secretion protein [Rhodanobacter denitrificans]